MRSFFSILAAIAALAVGLAALMHKQGSKPRRYVVNRTFVVEE